VSRALVSVVLYALLLANIALTLMLYVCMLCYAMYAYSLAEQQLLAPTGTDLRVLYRTHHYLVEVSFNH
jgi:hypothetical protein